MRELDETTPPGKAWLGSTEWASATVMACCFSRPVLNMASSQTPFSAFPPVTRHHGCILAQSTGILSTTSSSGRGTDRTLVSSRLFDARSAGLITVSSFQNSTSGSNPRHALRGPWLQNVSTLASSGCLPSLSTLLTPWKNAWTPSRWMTTTWKQHGAHFVIQCTIQPSSVWGPPPENTKAGWRELRRDHAASRGQASRLQGSYRWSHLHSQERRSEERSQHSTAKASGYARLLAECQSWRDPTLRRLSRHEEVLQRTEGSLRANSIKLIPSPQCWRVHTHHREGKYTRQVGATFQWSSEPPLYHQQRSHQPTSPGSHQPCSHWTPFPLWKRSRKQLVCCQLEKHLVETPSQLRFTKKGTWL